LKENKKRDFIMLNLFSLKAEKKEEGNRGASTKKRASAAQLRITKVLNISF